MVNSDQSAHRDLRALMSDVGDYGARTVDTLDAAHLGDDHANTSGPVASGRYAQGTKRMGNFGAALAGLTSMIALLFSGFSFYETVLKQAELRIYAPPLIYLYRQDFRDVYAIPITLSNDGAARGTVLSFDLEVENLDTKAKMKFQNLHFGASPKGDVRLFTPVTVPGRSAFTDVVLFHALETGAMFETTGGVKLPLRLTLSMNLDTTGEWFAPKQPPPMTFDMTANYIAGFRDMESGTPTQLHDARWTNAGKASAGIGADGKP